MMEEELRQLLREQGWNLFKRTRGQQEYLYAQKWRKGEIYIAPRDNVHEVTREQILRKIALQK